MVFTSQFMQPMVKIYDSGVSTATATTLTVTYPFKQNTHYRIVIQGMGETGSNWTSLFVEDDTAAANYYTQRIYATGAAVSAAVNNNALVFATYDGYNFFATMDFFWNSSTLKPMAVVECFAQTAANAALVAKHGWYTVNQVAAITHIHFTNTQANGFGIGTSLQVYEVQ